jgi:hypothetical protein
MLAWRVVSNRRHVLYVGTDFYATRAAFLRHWHERPFLQRGIVTGRIERGWMRCCARCGGVPREVAFTRYCERCAGIPDPPVR